MKSDARHYTQRLFNRLLFLYFIQKKGWLDFHDDKNYLRAMFTASESAKDSYLADRLNVCFHHLNTPIVERTKLAKERPLVGDVPFLNGGLFDLAGEPPITLANAAFGRVLALFERFNFTVSESTPLDVEVAVDPEMLGKVFEKLCTSRDATGSFYTPRHVVSFMCQEALKKYLCGRAVLPPLPLREGLGEGSSPMGGVPATTKNPPPPLPKREGCKTKTQYEDAVAKFVDDGDPIDLPDSAAVLKALESVTVCDPACGSGAYLLGMLQELLRLREALFVAKSGEPGVLWRHKKEVITRNLHGVDLEDFAVNIAKLRLWLCLAVEFNDTAPLPLPNLDFKIEAGDSLLAPHPDLKSVIGTKPGTKAVENTLFRQILVNKSAGLIKLKAEYLNCHDGPTKRKLFEQVRAMEAELRETLADQIPDGTVDWRINFAEVFNDGGFDIVVGNPPYVRQEEIKHLKPDLKKHYACYTGTADLFVFFYERGVRLLKPGGQFAFITSNKWYRSGYGEKLRDYLATNTTLHSLIDFGDAPVFEAIAYPTIVLLERTPPAATQEFRGLTWTPGPPVEEFVPVFRKESFTIPQASLHKTGWRLEGSAKRNLLDKLRAGGTPLGEYCQGRFFWGIKTGLNDAFVIDNDTRNKLVKTHASSKKVLKPFLRGRDVKRWNVDSQNLWLLYIPWHFPLHDDSSIKGASRAAEKKLREDYPAIYDHLSQFKEELKARNKAETGIRYEWYALQRWGSEHQSYYNDPKIVVPAITDDVNFAIDDASYYINNKATAFLPPHRELALAICNSPAVMWWVRNTSAAKQGGFFDFEPRYSSTIPIPAASAAEKEALAGLVTRIVAAKAAGKDVANLEAEVNQRVYALFSLTADEIKIIEDA